jgi:hypothetical protein
LSAVVSVPTLVPSTPKSGGHVGQNLGNYGAYNPINGLGTTTISLIGTGTW